MFCIFLKRKRDFFFNLNRSGSAYSTFFVSRLGLVYCLPPDASPDDCECTPDYLDCQSDYEEYSNWDAHCTRENPNQYYEYKCCLPKWYFAPMPDYDALEGQVILFMPCSVKTDY